MHEREALLHDSAAYRQDGSADIHRALRQTRLAAGTFQRRARDTTRTIRGPRGPAARPGAALRPGAQRAGAPAPDALPRSAL
jgi:hypothetical protein